jgi:hypothetical protein
LEFRIQGLGFRVAGFEGLGLWALSLRFMDQCFRVLGFWGSGIRVYGLGLRVEVKV